MGTEKPKSAFQAWKHADFGRSKLED